MKKIGIFLSVAALVCLLALGVSARSVTQSGTCGTNVTWTLYDDGALVISGTGAMNHYSRTYKNGNYITTAPWGDYASNILTVTIENGVTRIGNDAFRGCTGLTSVTIGDSVTSIGEYAFSSCSSLTSVTIGDSVTSIGNLAFSYCTSLASVTIPDSVKSIGGGAFRSCENLTSVTIGDSVTNIGYEAFYLCTTLEDVTIGDSVTSIDISAFYGCSSLTNVIIGDSVTSIGSDAFYRCTSLASVTIGSGVTRIDSRAFSQCYELSDIYYNGTEQQWNAIKKSDDWDYQAGDNAGGYTVHYQPQREILASGTCGDKLTWTLYDDGTLVISGTGDMDNYTSDYINGAFITTAPWYSNRSKIKTVTIENGVTSIGENAFNNCSCLASVTIPNSVTSIDWYAFEGCTDLASVKIPDSVTSIGYSAFEGCTGLASVTIPGGVTSIGNYAFEGCTDLASVTIGSGVTSIGEEAFRNCTSLSDIYYNGTEQQWNAITKGSGWDKDAGSYTVHLKDVPVTALCGDLNGDGKVTALDNAILARYLAKWKGYETLPYLK